MPLQEYIGFAGARLQADVQGWPEDPAVLMLHGGGQTRDMWKPTVESLVKAGRYVISLDLRGHGESDWPEDGRYDLDAYVGDLKSVLNELGSRPVIVAASLGGWIASVALGEEGSHLATGLVLVDAPPEIDVRKARKISDALKKRAETDAGSLPWDVRFLDGFDIESTLARITRSATNIKLPVLFVRGALSELTEHEAATRFLESFKNPEFAEIKESRHLVTEERSDLFNAAIVDFLERRVPRFTPEYRSGSDARTLRDALGCFATGVTVVTAMTGEQSPIGLTANSFTSVSLDPALLLVCIAKSAGSLSSLKAASHFGVNVLHIGQQGISNTFAKPGEDRFAQTPWQRGNHDVPLINGALANFECRQQEIVDGGDHEILIGEVLRAKFEPRRDPLLYFGGKYRRLHFS
ncbi:alpha/beta fold hydrolase [Henriciella mobilis]|uniref:Alpha/beta fold hydrolase n=1 Tax=Henriciella mobilis TaxID=2305467 RepID=A0A399RIP2_9PROT|nr:alpha/beta fold hydrolase [Henriciella mobilis]RIJ17245.1 alpha/beta fold hydrolase [Henriciella mobilis]RIJ22456.1 alpha/beta fold hydrolase [Henriciella mobilis]RIJ29877.1 alpha/beta fold hydrolase [Henriciella mobilis]